MPENIPYPLPPQPKAIITLKVADDRDKQIWVTEKPAQVLARMADAKADRTGVAPMIELTRWRAMQTDLFYTRFDNIANVEAYR